MPNLTTGAASTLTKLSPVGGPAAGGTPVTLTGTGLANASVVRFGGTQVNIISASATTVTVLAPAGSGTVQVQVNVPTGWVAGTPPLTFTYVAATMTGVSPAYGPTTGGTPVTISGTGLTGATAVMFGTAQANVISATATTVTAVTPACAAGTDSVRVVLPTGTMPVAPAATFQFLAPTVTKIHPAAGPVTGGTKVTLIGNYLSGATSVQFGGIAASAAPVILSDNEITVITPMMPKQQTVGVQVNLPTGLVPATAAAAPQFAFGPPGPPVNAPFVVVNKTGLPDALVYVKFLGAPIVADSLAPTYGAGLPLGTGTATAAQSYSLAEMTSPMTLGGVAKTVPNFALNNFSGGRIYFSLLNKLQSTTIPAAQISADPDFPTVYGYVEPSVFPNALAGNTNLDTSYVDFVGLPINIAIRNTSDGTHANPPANNPLLTPPGLTLFNALTGDPQVPPQAVVTAKGSVKVGGGRNRYIINGTARILSPSLYDPTQFAGGTPYHGWTQAGGLIKTLRAAKTVLKVASYVTSDPSAAVPTGTLFGYSGSKAAPAISAAWMVAQSYALTATAVADLNPNSANPRIPQLSGKPGILLTGNGGTVGAFSLYLLDSDMEKPAGVYGANPPYVVDWAGQPGGAQAYSMPGIKNDLAGRVVGDLLAGFNFGWAACATTVAAQAATTGTAANLTGTVFDVNSGLLTKQPLGALSTGQFFYLLSLQPNTAAVAKWFGQSIQPSAPNFYNNYASDFQSLTNCYNMAFTDRLQGLSDPDMFFTPGPQTYVEITLLPGAYTVTKQF